MNAFNLLFLIISCEMNLLAASAPRKEICTLFFPIVSTLMASLILFNFNNLHTCISYKRPSAPSAFSTYT
uniref:Secreted protein n=1 Tax=Panstrongylus lignarius TaxID=156445 RepID=A0A224Y4V2_9HEMI